ncbi:MAG: organomercurial lyase MerB [Acidobacteriota bacterium]|nr:MAG: organomercurial lyase MerB [Acidobacteriota bacterium]
MSMETAPVDLDALAARFFECMPPLDADGKKISIALYRLLAEGEPVPSGELAKKVGLDEKLVQEKLQSWAGVFFDEQGSIQGYWGLAIAKMNHRFEVEGRTLYTWCAWDSLFLPEILRKTAQVSSSCPVTGETIRLRVSSNEIETVEPVDLVMSFPGVDRMALGEDVVTNFCHFVHFFRSPEAANRWLEKHPGHLILSPDDAFALAHKKNALRYGELG